MSLCIICGNITKNIPLCKNCLKSPFNVEKLREYYVRENDLVNFRETYSYRYSEINNKNTGQIWNNKFAFFVNNYSKENNNFMDSNKINDVLSLIKNEKGKLLDIGIGLGNLEEKLYKINRNIEVWGVDNSSYAINLIKRKIPGNFINSSIFDISFREEMFDLICCLDLLEHISPSKTFLLLDKIFRLLKPGGKLIITIPLNEGLKEMINIGNNPNLHVRIYTPLILETELKLSSFNIISKKYYMAFKKMYKLKSFICKLFTAIRKPNLIMVVARKR